MQEEDVNRKKQEEENTRQCGRTKTGRFGDERRLSEIPTNLKAHLGAIYLRVKTHFKSQFGPGFRQQLFVSSGTVSQRPSVHAHDVDDQEFADAEFRFGAADARNVRADAREFVSDDGGAQRRVQASTYRIGVAAGIPATRVGSRFEEGLHAGNRGGWVDEGLIWGKKHNC